MQTARVFRLIAAPPVRPRRGRRPTLRIVTGPQTASARCAPRKRRRGGRRGWIKTMLVMFVVALEWLLVAVDIITRVYFA
jgi:hypothetical protein